MTDPDLVRRAKAAGIAPVYRNWRQEAVEVSADTLAAILAALRAAPGAAGHPAAGPAPDGPAGSAPRPRLPDRCWGFTVQLYSVRSRRSWGHGDFGDLARLAAWSAADLGAGFLLVNPLHAAEPLPPVSPSPYLPMTRRFRSPLYLRVEDIPEYQQLEAGQRARIAALAAPLRARNGTPDLIDRDAVWSAKREALEIIYGVPRRGPRAAAYQDFRSGQGAELASWASWCALAERHGPDWRRWPAALRDPRRGMSVTARGPLAGRADFHAWLQWLADEQLAAAQQAALAAGMQAGIIGDLAVGVHPGGADAWAHQDLLVRGVSVGAPPDEFNQLGQEWGQPPWHPQRLAAAGYRPLQDLFRAALRHSGGLRVDHVMGLMRLWWVPEGMSPDQGAYVSYDHQAALSALSREAARAGAVAIGEDLGTVEPWIQQALAASGILGTTLLWFACEPDRSPLRPDHWRPACMATVGSHDLPTVAGFLSGEQVSIRARLGLLTGTEEQERRAAGQLLRQWQYALRREGLLPGGPQDRPDSAQFAVALYAYLARTPSAIVGVSLADAVGDARAQNIPGTSRQYPNWRVPLCAGDGRAVVLEELPNLPLVWDVARAAAPAAAPARRAQPLSPPRSGARPGS